MDSWQREVDNYNKKTLADLTKHNDNIFKVPEYLSDDEKIIYAQILDSLKHSIKYRLSPSDEELVWQYCQLKIIRDKSWREYNKNPDRYIRIVTGICSDGKTPKVMVKENEHYKTWLDCNKHLEKIIKDLRLTPDTRRK